MSWNDEGTSGRIKIIIALIWVIFALGPFFIASYRYLTCEETYHACQ